MTATAVFLLLMVVLASVLNQTTTVWSRNESKSQLRETARAALDLIGSELSQAVLPVDPADTTGLQFVIDPDGLPEKFSNRNAIFWHAPVATTKTAGEVALVGYFVRSTDGGGSLCRLLITPDDPDFPIDGPGASHLSETVFEQRAPADPDGDFRGLFLENVPGMWIRAYDSQGNVYTDSRELGALPSRVEITIAMLDKAGAARVASGAAVLPEAKNHTGIVSFLAAVPDALKPHLETVTVNVSFHL